MKKECIRFAPMIGSREGELEADEAKALAAHLASCETCRALAADVAATDGMVADALLRSANSRDFSTFADGVMERLGLEDPSTAPAPRAGSARGERIGARAGGLLAWLRGHRARAVAAALVPALAALLVLVYVRSEGGPGSAAMLELSSEGEATTVLQTADGPVVLLQEEPGT
jgi:anti-sigma factor RsiW